MHEWVCCAIAAWAHAVRSIPLSAFVRKECDMKLRRSIVAIAACALASVASAFPVLFPTHLTVSPLIPNPGERVVIKIHDSPTGHVPAPYGYRLVGIDARGDGSRITITGIWEGTGLVDTGLEYHVDLGPLPAGRYIVNYSSDSPLSPGLHRATLEFSVTTEGYVRAIEYYHAGLDHYFVTAFPAEIAALDSGRLSGWTRTGESFGVMAADAMPSTAAIAVCRFYGLPAAGINSHFFSSLASECAEVQQRWPQAWRLETPKAFGTAYDMWSGSNCPAGFAPLYRLYNRRPDVNHRYTTSPQTRDAMIARGWILEGRPSDNRDGSFVMCVLQ